MLVDLLKVKYTITFHISLSFSLRVDKSFNHSLFVDTFCIDSKPILHAVDWPSRYKAAHWFLNVAVKSVWRQMRFCWIDVPFGPPAVAIYDAGKQFIPKAFRTNAELLHIKNVRTDRAGRLHNRFEAALFGYLP